MLFERGQFMVETAINIIDLLNFSGGWSDNNPGYNYAVDTVIGNYTGLFICSAGNDNFDNDTVNIYPANYSLPNMITVGASNSANQKWDNSNYGQNTVDFFGKEKLEARSVSGSICSFVNDMRPKKQEKSNEFC